MTEYETASLALTQGQLWVSGIVGLVQCALITWGLWMMHSSAKQRDSQLQQQAEHFAELVRRGDQQGRALERQTEALTELLRRSP